MWFVIISAFVADVFAISSQRCKEQRIDGYTYQKFYLNRYLISFLILALLCILCKSGTDIPVYVNYYNLWGIDDLFSLDFEPGYVLFTVLIRLVFKNPYIGIGIIKIISIALVFRAVYLIRKRINVGIAISAYIGLLYIFNFHLLRMMMAVGLVFVAWAYEIIGKRKRCFLYLVIALFFHFSSFLAFFAYLYYLLLKKNISTTKIVISSLFWAIVFIYIPVILNSIIYNIGLFQKYKTYLAFSIGSFGIVQFLLFIPVVLILINGYSRGKNDSFYVLSFVCGIMTFFTGCLGYVYATISRSVYYFYFFFVAYCAAASTHKEKITLTLGKAKCNGSTLLFTLYILMQIFLYYIFGNGFSTNGMIDYLFIWQ